MFCNNACSSLGALFPKVLRPTSVWSMRFVSSKPVDEPPKQSTTDRQINSFTAKDIEFCPNRAREVLQNYVAEASQSGCNEDPFAKGKKFTPADPMSERDHLEAYKAGNSVSLYSVMQSNVPVPFSSRGKAPTHLNMPGGSSSQGYKYLSGQMQNVHQSKK